MGCASFRILLPSRDEMLSRRARARTQRAAWSGRTPRLRGPMLPAQRVGGKPANPRKRRLKTSGGKKDSERKKLGEKGRHLQGQDRRGDGRQMARVGGQKHCALIMSGVYVSAACPLSPRGCPRRSRRPVTYSRVQLSRFPLPKGRGAHTAFGDDCTENPERRFTELTLRTVSPCKSLFLLQTEQ